MPTLSDIMQREIGKGVKSKTYIANQLGVSEKTIENYMRGLRQPRPDALVRLSKLLDFKLSELSESFEQSVPRNTLAEEPAPTIAANGQKYHERRRDEKNISRPVMVPLVPVKAQAGYAASYDNTDFIQNLEMYPILPGIDPRGAVWRFFEVAGDSMEPTLFETDLVLVSMVPSGDWQDIKKGEVYVIVTDDDVFIKKVVPKDKTTWILRSVNKRKGDKTLNVSDIKEVWRYRRHVTNKIQLPKE